MAVLPYEPFRVSDRTPICDRLALMEALVREGAADAAVRAWMWRPGDAPPVQPPGHGARDKVAWALRRVQELPYWLYPDGEVLHGAATTVRVGGDCKAVSVVFCAAMAALKVPCRVVWVDQPAASLNHVSAVVWLDGRWQWADASVRGAWVGEPPYAAARRLGASDRSELRS